MFYIHIGVGFALLRSTIPGNAKASWCGTSNDDSSTSFYFCRKKHIL